MAVMVMDGVDDRKKEEVGGDRGGKMAIEKEVPYSSEFIEYWMKIAKEMVSLSAAAALVLVVVVADASPQI
ncbi:Hypothetical predicted protein [Octopus vulgaris]|uniref:Uncharacterized protein n=1 Tax=Octopus vulgaris TaxID=6645 RepID=A0AA36AY29_OCTVU|nr:Hypothetical predicted protein [Octopus vulgaris]